MRIAADKANLQITSVHHATLSEWLYWQWIHLIFMPKINEPSLYWKYMNKNIYSDNQLKQLEKLTTFVLLLNIPAGMLPVKPVQLENKLAKVVTSILLLNIPVGMLPVNPLQPMKHSLNCSTLGLLLNSPLGMEVNPVQTLKQAVKDFTILLWLNSSGGMLVNPVQPQKQL